VCPSGQENNNITVNKLTYSYASFGQQNMETDTIIKIYEQKMWVLWYT